MRRVYLVFVVSCILFGANAYQRPDFHNLNKTVEHLLGKLQDSFVNATTPPGWDGLNGWGAQAGLWKSFIHINIPSNIGPIATLFRLFQIEDSNFFVTGWIVELMLQADQISKGVVYLSQDYLIPAQAALNEYRDKNYPVGEAIYSFWPQVEYNGTYIAFPPNLVWLLAQSYTGPENPLEQIVSELSEGIFDGEDLNSVLGDIHWNHKRVDDNESQARAFFIPADFDDMGVNLGLGSLLSLQSQSHNGYDYVSQQWLSENNNWSALFAAYNTYAYQPFANDNNLNLIDPRTYAWINNYLQLKNSSVPISIITTWVLDVEFNRQTYYDLYAMPFNINNVDASVCANAIYGITHAVLQFPDAAAAFDSDSQKLYQDTVDLLSWLVRHPDILNKRPDLVLLYYMGTYNFYFFVSRTLNLLNAYSGSLPFPCFEYARIELQEALRTGGTEYIMSKAIHDSPYVYWEDFLGTNDTTITGETVDRGDDRICTTAVSVLALLNSWTSASSRCMFDFANDVPANVTSAMENAVKFLIDYAAGERYRHENAFFSGSVKVNHFSKSFFLQSSLMVLTI